MENILPIRIKELSLGFDKPLLQSVDLKVKSGEFVVLSGGSGFGKSSIIKLLLGLTKATKGEVKVFGLDVNPTNIKHIRSRIAWLPQNFDSLANGIVQEFILDIFKINKLNYGRERLEKEFEKLNLSRDILHVDFKNLSGGEKQRISMIIAKLLDKELYLLDEPSSALDSANKDLALDYLSMEGKSYFVVTHTIAFMKGLIKFLKLKTRNSSR